MSGFSNYNKEQVVALEALTLISKAINRKEMLGIIDSLHSMKPTRKNNGKNFSSRR